MLIIFAENGREMQLAERCPDCGEKADRESKVVVDDGIIIERGCPNGHFWSKFYGKD